MGDKGKKDRDKSQKQKAKKQEKKAKTKQDKKPGKTPQPEADVKLSKATIPKESPFLMMNFRKMWVRLCHPQKVCPSSCTIIEEK